MGDVNVHEPVPESGLSPGPAGKPAPPARNLSPQGVLALQRAVGNRATRALLQRGTYVEVYKQSLVKGPTLRLSIKQRPTNQTDALGAIVDEMWAKWPDLSQSELKLVQDSGADKDTAKQLVQSKQWLSKNNAAVCHKLAISAFMNDLREWVANLYEDICFGVTPAGDAEMADLIAQMTVNNPTHPARQWFTQLRQYRTPPMFVAKDYKYAETTIAAVDGLCDALVRELNRAPDNLYIGSAPANSWIQEYYDPHVPMDPTSTAEVQATPRSRAIYDAEHRFAASCGVAPSSPRRDTDSTTGDPMYGTSSVISQPGHHPWNYPPPNPTGGWYQL